MAPQLDVSDAILDPDFCDFLDITRRPYTTDAMTGRVIVTPSTVSPAPIGVVTQGSPDKFQQVPDDQVAKDTITIHAYNFQLYDVQTGQASSFQPDIVNYNGNRYIVVKVNNWSQYGQGFTMAVADLYDLTEAG